MDARADIRVQTGPTVLTNVGFPLGLPENLTVAHINMGPPRPHKHTSTKGHIVSIRRYLGILKDSWGEYKAPAFWL